MARVASALVQYQSNNNGKLPGADNVGAKAGSGDGAGGFPSNCGSGKGNNAKGSACNFIKTYMNSAGATKNEFVDPNGDAYGMKIYKGAKGYTAPTSFDRIVYIITGAKCKNDGTGGVEDTNNTRSFAITFMTEGSGLYCSESK